MINSVRNTVLSILNKNNYGYISPSDFNLYAKQAQMEIFEGYFSDYNSSVTKQNLRREASGYADNKAKNEAIIDTFLVTNPLKNVSYNQYYLPSLATTGDDYFLLTKCLFYSEVIYNHETTAAGSTHYVLKDSGADFVTIGVSKGDIVAVENGGVYYGVVTNVAATELTTTIAQFDASGLPYSVIARGTRQEEAERMSQHKITMLINSNLTTPTVDFPVYSMEEDYLYFYPDGEYPVGQLSLQYVRYPKEPKWTHSSLTNGEPVFNSSATDYQDFELPLQDEPKLVSKICQYAGVSIREAEVVQVMASKEMYNQQAQQQS